MVGDEVLEGRARLRYGSSTLELSSSRQALKKTRFWGTGQARRHVRVLWAPNDH